MSKSRSHNCLQPRARSAAGAVRPGFQPGSEGPDRAGRPRCHASRSGFPANARWIAALIGLATLAAPQAVPAAEEPEILVEVSPDRIYQGQSVLYSVTLNHVRNPSPPDLSHLDDFDVQSLGERSLDSTMITIINGRRTEVIRRGREYRYRLTPRKTGRLVIPAPRAVADGRQLVGAVRHLEVVPAEQQDTVRMAITADRRAVYPMQPFTVTLSVSVRGLPAPFADRDPLSVQWDLGYHPPTLRIPWIGQLPEGLEADSDLNAWAQPLLSRQSTGFSINELATGSSSFFSLLDDRQLATFRPHPQRVTERDRHGRLVEYWQYDFSRTFVARRIADYAFGPVTVEGRFVTDVNARGEANVERIYAMARKIDVSVQDAPEEGRPATFTGAIGRFALDARLTPTRAKVGDPMKLTLTLSGQGTLESTSPPDLAHLPEIASRFRVHEPEQESQTGAVRFTYIVRPQEAAIRQFPSIPLAYFDVEKERYATLRTQPIEIEVAAAERLTGDKIVSGTATAAARPNELEARREGIFANELDPAAVRNQAVRPERWLIGLGGLTGLYLALAVVTIQVRRLRADEAWLRRRGAPGRARRALHEGLRQLRAGQVRGGTEKIRSALCGLVADVADLPPAGLTPKDARQTLETMGLEEPLTARVGQLLETCDGAQFGAFDQDPGTFATRAEALLEETVQALKARKRFR